MEKIKKKRGRPRKEKTIEVVSDVDVNIASTKETEKLGCDHIWIKNEGEGERYICQKCGKQSA